MQNKIFYKYLILILLLFIANATLAQDAPPAPPPHKENTYLFTIQKYDRQPKPSKAIMLGIQALKKKPKNEWTSKDSLNYAYENTYLRHFGSALNIFTRINTDTIQSKIGQTLYRTTLQHTNRFKELLAYNKKHFPTDNKRSSYSTKDAFIDLTNAYIAYQNGKFFLDSNIIFKILVDGSLKKEDKYLPKDRNKFTQVSIAIDSALRQFSILNKDQDRILAQAFKEATLFQEKYLYLTNAYFYSSASLYYYRNDKTIIKTRNHIINTMNDRNYMSIKFPTLFGKIVKKRYHFSNDYIEKNKTVITQNKKVAEPPKRINDDLLPGINLSLLYIIIIVLLLILVIFFVKTKEKK